MPTERIPVAEIFTNRDSSASKDARLTNCFIRMVGGKPMVVKRPGITTYASNTVGQGQGIYHYGDSVYSISGGVLTRNKGGVITTYALAADSLVYDFSSSALTSLLVFKSSANMYTFAPGTSTLTHITSVNYPATTVRGLVYLDGYFVVATSDGKIWNSALEDPTTWSATNYTSAEIEPDALVAINKVLNNIVALGTQTTEFFYDAANPTGSPFSPVDNAFSEIGCSSADSVVRTGNQLIWISRNLQRGRQVTMLTGFTPEVISTPEIELILNADNLSAVYSFIVKMSGGYFYFLTLENTNRTMVYDLTTKTWWDASSMHLGSSSQPTAITNTSTGIVIFTLPGHGLSQGDSVSLTGVIPLTGNISYPITYMNANQFYIYYTGSMNPIVPTATTAVPSYAIPGYAIPALTNVTITTYTEGYLQFTYYTTDGVNDYIQGENNGKVYTMSPTVYTDDGTYINTVIRTPRIDFGNAKRKFMSRLEIIADKVGAFGYIRYSDDDYNSWVSCPGADMSADRTILRRMGHFRRRAFEFRFVDNAALRIQALEVDVEQGTS